MAYAIRQRRMIRKPDSDPPYEYKVMEQIIVVPGVSTHPDTYSTAGNEIIIADNLEKQEASRLLEVRG